MDIGIYGLWFAAFLTLITGFDYLYVGLKHITETDHAPAGRHPDQDEIEDEEET